MSTSTSFNTVTVGLLLPRVPIHYENIRSGADGLLERARQSLLARLHLPGQHDAVRGLSIAGENLIQCLLLESGESAYDYKVFAGAPPAGYKHWLNQRTAQASARIDVAGAPTLLRGGLRGVRLWYEPLANYDIAYELRDRLADQAYPIVSTVHGLSLHTMLMKYYARILLCDTIPTDSFVCSTRESRGALQRLMEHVSETFRDRYQLRRSYSGRYDVIPLPVDTAALCPGDPVAAKRKFKLPADCTLVLYLGLISNLKADLLPSLIALAERKEDLDRHNIVFVIAGGGDQVYVDTLLDHARTAGFPTSRLRVIKDPPDSTKLDLLRAADIFTSPADALQESFGLSVVEAMACGVPQVVADWDGYRETVQDGVTGFRAPTRWARCDEDLRHTGLLMGWTYDHEVLGQSVAMDVDYWVEAVLRLARSPELRRQMSAASRRRSVASYSMTAVRKQYFDLWSDLLACPPAPWTRKPRHLESPRYYDCFSHYASASLGPTTSIEVVENSRFARIEKADAFPRFVKPHILAEVLRLSTGRRDVEGIVKGLKDKASHMTAVRHILWALKYGLVKVADEPRAAPSLCATAGRSVHQ